MTFAAVGSIIENFNIGTTFPLTPGAVGDLILLEVIDTTGTSYPTAMSGSSVTWTQLGTRFTGTVNTFSAVIFAGKVTSTAPDTVTVTWNGSFGINYVVGQEFSSTAGSWQLDVQGSIDGSGTNTWASLTPAAAGELYFGYGYTRTAASAGSTPGYTYDVDAHANGLAFNPACSSAVQAPVWADTDMLFGSMVLVSEVSPTTPVSSADSCSMASGTPVIRGFPATARQWIRV